MGLCADKLIDGRQMSLPVTVSILGKSFLILEGFSGGSVIRIGIIP